MNEERRFTLRRRSFVIGAAAAVAIAPGCAQPAQAREATVYKTPYCGCCSGWVTHLRRAGFTAKVIEVDDLTPIRARQGVPAQLSSCHTALIGGYVVEGHVPIEDVERLLRQKPKAVGLVVPGMPIGSPGMEVPQGKAEPYKTLLLLDRSGRTREFARHGPRA